MQLTGLILSMHTCRERRIWLVGTDRARERLCAGYRLLTAHSPQKLNGCLDLDFSDRNTFNIAPDRNVPLMGKMSQLPPVLFRKFDRLLKDILRVNQFILQPSGDADAEPLHELKRFQRAARREGEDDRYERNVLLAAMVVIIGKEIF